MSASPNPTWVVVLGPDATVLAVKNAPPEWAGTRFDKREDVPAELREAAAALVRAVHQPSRSMAMDAPRPWSDEPDAPLVQLIAIEAIPIRRSAMDLRALLSSAMEVLAAQATTLDVDLRVKCDENFTGTVSLDPEKVAWAVSTLVGNAFRYVRRGTRLRPGGTITVTMSRDDGEVAIAVQDDGPGIPKDKVKFLFKKSEGAQHAVGLGLLLVHDVVVAHGGRIDVKTSTDTFDHGTTITLRLPVR